MRLGNRTMDKKESCRATQKTQVTTFGSGAIVDMPDYSVIIGALDYWKPKIPCCMSQTLRKFNEKAEMSMFLKILMDTPNRHSCIQISSYALCPVATG